MMRMIYPRATMLGKRIVVTDRVKKGKLYLFEGYVLVNMMDEMELNAWMQGTARRERGPFFL